VCGLTVLKGEHCGLDRQNPHSVGIKLGSAQVYVVSYLGHRLVGWCFSGFVTLFFVGKFVSVGRNIGWPQFLWDSKLLGI
jgi:hypothetical protein